MITDISKLKSLDKALKLAGLSWDVEAQPLVVKLGSYSQDVPGYQVITRRDTGQVLSIVGERFSTGSRPELFAAIEEFVKNGCEFRLAGSMDGGRRVFVQINTGLSHLGADAIEQRLTFFDSHDSSSAPFVLATPVRLASSAANNFAIPDVERRVVLRRGATVDCAEILAMADSYFKSFDRNIAVLQSKTFSAGEAFRMLASLLPSDEGEVKVPTRTANNRRQLLELLAGGAKHEENGIVGTRWGALQAVVEYVDCHRGTRVKGDDDANTRRLESAFFGSGLQLKQSAFDFLTDYGKVTR